MAIHFGTFALGDDGYAEAPRVLANAPQQRARFVVLDRESRSASKSSLSNLL